MTTGQGMTSQKQNIISLSAAETANDFNLTRLVSTPTHTDGLSGPSKNEQVNLCIKNAYSTCLAQLLICAQIFFSTQVIGPMNLDFFGLQIALA